MDNVLMINEPFIRVTKDEMKAYLTLPELPTDQEYILKDVLESIKHAGVVYGLNESIVKQMIAQKIFDREVLVARGVSVANGVDGFYQYNFNVELNNKPEIRTDGTVDYWSIHAVEIVEEGQVIAIYNEPTPGQDGMTVRGKRILAKKGRPLPPLTGKGFERSEDNRIYTATIAGKIEKKDNRIQITSVYEVFGNVDMHTGNIEFRGDVIIHGNITSGFSVKATGSVTIDGTAESCYIEAGRDVILRGGMLGGHKGAIKSKGNIYARFIEYATVTAEGFLDANSALSSSITCYDKVYMKGRQANIIGGEVYSAGGVEAACIGNQSEVNTYIQVGVSRELMDELMTVENQLNEDNEMIGKINEGIQRFDEAAKAKNLDLRNDERRVALLRTRIIKQADVAKAREEQARLKGIMEHAKGATVRVMNVVYPGVRVSVNTSTAKLKDFQNSVEFTERMGKVVMVSLQDEVVV